MTPAAGYFDQGDLLLNLPGDSIPATTTVTADAALAPTQQIAEIHSGTPGFREEVAEQGKRWVVSPMVAEPHTDESWQSVAAASIRANAESARNAMSVLGAKHIQMYRQPWADSGARKLPDRAERYQQAGGLATVVSGVRDNARHSVREPVPGLNQHAAMPGAKLIPFPNWKMSAIIFKNSPFFSPILMAISRRCKKV